MEERKITEYFGLFDLSSTKGRVDYAIYSRVHVMQLTQAQSVSSLTELLNSIAA